jgi:hypothetical protein
MISSMVPGGQHIVEAAGNEILILLVFVYLAVRAFRYRNAPRIGGKIGRRWKIKPAEPIPDGFSSVFNRAVTIFTPAAGAAPDSNLKTFLRKGMLGRQITMRIYRVRGCKTEIEIPAAAPDYERIGAADALALLRELPDPRLVRRLHVSDEPSVVDPWVRKFRGQFILGHATNSGLIVIYRPDRRQREVVGLTVLHEWLHVLAFGSTLAIWRFSRANAVEPLPLAAGELVLDRARKNTIHEAWSYLGEKLFGYNENVARTAALSSPVHAMIVWQRVETMMHLAPERLRSSRFAEWERRAAFMRAEVAPRAKAARRKRWARLFGKG